jgi:hypothetical protein
MSTADGRLAVRVRRLTAANDRTSTGPDDRIAEGFQVVATYQFERPRSRLTALESKAPERLTLAQPDRYIPRDRRR